MVRMIVAIPNNSGFEEFATPDNSVLAYKTKFGTIIQDSNIAHNTKV